MTAIWLLTHPVTISINKQAAASASSWPTHLTTPLLPAMSWLIYLLLMLGLRKVRLFFNGTARPLPRRLINLNCFSRQLLVRTVFCWQSSNIYRALLSPQNEPSD